MATLNPNSLVGKTGLWSHTQGSSCETRNSICEVCIIIAISQVGTTGMGQGQHPCLGHFVLCAPSMCLGHQEPTWNLCASGHISALIEFKSGLC